MDKMNVKNKDWRPAEKVNEPVWSSPEMEDSLKAAPELCGCEECHREATEGYNHVQGADSEGGQHNHGVNNEGGQHGQEALSEGG